MKKNLTSREAKRLSFQFNITHKNVGKTPGTLGPQSLAGSNALTVIAETEELRNAQLETIKNLYDGFWTTEILLGSENGYNLEAAKVLESLHPHLFDKRDPINLRNEERYMSTFDACELLRQRLNQCVILLRSQKTLMSTLTNDGLEHTFESICFSSAKRGRHHTNSSFH